MTDTAGVDGVAFLFTGRRNRCSRYPDMLSRRREHFFPCLITASALPQNIAIFAGGCYALEFFSEVVSQRRNCVAPISRAAYAAGVDGVAILFASRRNRRSCYPDMLAVCREDFFVSLVTALTLPEDIAIFTRRFYALEFDAEAMP